jgi:DNA-binding response OmpR family regulator
LPHGNEIVLLVEDEPLVRQFAELALEMLGYKVLVADGVASALRIASEYRGKIDLLLTDIVMPEMNGWELSRRLQECRPDLPCLFMSGYTAAVAERQHPAERGGSFIQKPFSFRDLALKLRAALSTPAAPIE